MSPETSLTLLIGRLTAIFATWAYLFASFQQIQSADSLVRIIDEDKLNFQVPFSSTLCHRLFSFLCYMSKWLPGSGSNETARKCRRTLSGLPRTSADAAPTVLLPYSEVQISPLRAEMPKFVMSPSIDSTCHPKRSTRLS